MAAIQSGRQFFDEDQTLPDSSTDRASFSSSEIGFSSSAILSDEYRNRLDKCRVKLTEELIANIRCDKEEKWLFDIENPYLAVRARKCGSSSFYRVQKRITAKLPWEDTQDAKREWLGSTADYTLNEVRRKIDLLRAGILLKRKPPRLRGSLRVAELVQTYKAEFPSEHSNWFRTRNRLLDTYLVSRYGNGFLAGISKDQWLLLIDKALLDRKSRGEHLLNALRRFLYWATDRGVLQANPLAKVKIELSNEITACTLDSNDLLSLFDAAQELGQPWNAMIALMIFTGEAIEDIRCVEATDIDWRNATWRVGLSDNRLWNYGQARAVHLVPEVMTLLEPFRTGTRYLFPSPRPAPAPINLHSEILQRMKALSAIPGEWSLRDCRRTVYGGIGSKRPTKLQLEDWAERLAVIREAREKKLQEMNDVEL